MSKTTLTLSELLWPGENANADETIKQLWDAQQPIFESWTDEEADAAGVELKRLTDEMVATTDAWIASKDDLTTDAWKLARIRVLIFPLVPSDLTLPTGWEIDAARRMMGDQ